jgi:hypothetical protein
MDTHGIGFALEVATFLILVGSFCVVVIFGVRAAMRDARRRGKSPVLVAIACVFFFPWGLVAWLIFRPDPIQTRNRFNLQDFRAQ